jgi:hypothetical protein
MIAGNSSGLAVRIYVSGTMLPVLVGVECPLLE